MNLSRFGGPYLSYREAVRDGLIAAGAYPSPEWFRSQWARIGRAYDMGEPVDMIVATLALMAQTKGGRL